MPYVLNGETLSEHRPIPLIGETRHASSILTLWSREALATIGIVWAEPEPPVVSLEEQRDARNLAVNVKREQVFEAGFLVEDGALAGCRLQLRGADDKANWLIVEKNARKAVAVGGGEVAIIPVRTLENQTIMVSPLYVLDVLDALEAWGLTVMSRSWTLKDQNDRAASAEDLVTEEELETGWS